MAGRARELDAVGRRARVRGDERSRALRHGRLEPRAAGLLSAVRRPAARARLDATPTRCARHAASTERCSSSPRSRARRSSRARCTRLPTRSPPATAALRRDHRPRPALEPAGAGARASARIFHQPRRTSAAATRRWRVRPRAGGARRAPTCASCSSAPRRWTPRGPSRRRPRANPAPAARRALGGLASARPRQADASSTSPSLGRLGAVARAADRRVHGQARQGHRAGRRRAARRARASTATTASSCTCTPSARRRAPARRARRRRPPGA